MVGDSVEKGRTQTYLEQFFLTQTLFRLGEKAKNALSLN